MQIIEISRTYSRTLEFTKPDGSKIWIRHEMSAKASTDETDDLKATGMGLEEICRKEVAASIKAEKDKIEASMTKTDEPFPGKTPGVRSMPQL